MFLRRHFGTSQTADVVPFLSAAVYPPVVEPSGLKWSSTFKEATALIYEVSVLKDLFSAVGPTVQYVKKHSFICLAKTNP